MRALPKKEYRGMFQNKGLIKVDTDVAILFRAVNITRPSEEVRKFSDFEHLKNFYFRTNSLKPKHTVSITKSITKACQRESHIRTSHFFHQGV